MNPAILLIASCLIGLSPVRQNTGHPDQPLMHTRTEFSFTVRAPYRTVAPLFGPDAERSWGGHEWNPNFIYPLPAGDVAGAVFTVQHGGHSSLWITTAFDLKEGHVQYVYTMDNILLTLIDIHIEKSDARVTFVHVAYERTALKPEANEHVKHMGSSDAKMGGEWASAIDGYLNKTKK
ncbi:MAG: hypothetical protein ACREDR_11895 [Blastocatellia bacterium]